MFDLAVKVNGAVSDFRRYSILLNKYTVLQFYPMQLILISFGAFLDTLMCTMYLNMLLEQHKLHKTDENLVLRKKLLVSINSLI
jgi:hypothetical protein